jgi:hypothetical protein
MQVHSHDGLSPIAVTKTLKLRWLATGYVQH